MLVGGGLLALCEVALLVYCALDALTTAADRVRTLPKLLWLVLVLFVPVLGPVAWLVAGRPRGPRRSWLPGAPAATLQAAPPRPGAGPDDDQDFLDGLRRRAEEQRRRGRGTDPLG